MIVAGALSVLLVLGADVESLRDAGPPANRIDLVILGDGFRVEDQAALTSEANHVVDLLFAAPPWKQYESLFNVSLVHVISNENGADNGSYGATRDTALGAYFNCSGIDRALCINYGAVFTAANAAVPTYDVLIVIVNDPKYGGTGGTVATLSIHSLAPEILIHEMGHTLGKLADEYSTAYPGYPVCSGDCYEANATLNGTSTVKWSAWLESSTPVPTPEGSGYGATIGVFEGARYQTSGVYRPHENCKMRTLGPPFCSVCSEGQVLKFANRVWFFDGHSPTMPTSVSACSRANFSFTPLALDGSALTYAWTVNGVAQSAGTSLSVDASSDLSVSVTAKHSTAFVRSDPLNLLTDTLTFPLVTSTPCDGSCLAGACVAVEWANVSNLTAEATDSTGAVVSYAPTATQGGTGLAVTCAPASGAKFGIATTPVACTAQGGSRRTFTVTVRDTTAPVITLPANQTVEASSASGATVTFTASAVDSVDGSRATTCVPASGSVFPIGVTTVTCQASDTRSNQASGSFVVTVVDTTAPSLMLPAAQTVEIFGNAGSPVSYVASASDLVDGAVTLSCSKASGDTFAVGVTTVTCTATDSRGNMASGTFTVTVRDLTAPTFVVPADLSVEASSSAGAVVTFTVTAKDSAQVDVPVTCVPASGATFPLGLTRVTCSAGTGTAQFSVTVRDTTPPSLRCPNSLMALVAGAMTTVTYPPAMVSDAVSNANVTYSAPSGADFPKGVTPVTVTATDAASNATTCTFNVEVVDELVVADAGVQGGDTAGVIGYCSTTNGSLGLWALVAVAMLLRARRVTNRQE